jgi:hypothetical protein
MSIETVTRILQFILAPVVMITSCAILSGGMQVHYGAINDRLRTLAHERLELLRRPDGRLTVPTPDSDEYTVERLHQIDAQVPQLLRRHEMVHNALLATYLAILGFIGSMFVIATAALTNSAAAASAALYIFLASTAILLVGIAQLIIDIRVSQRAVQYEARRVLSLGTTPTPASAESPSDASAPRHEAGA